MEFSRFLGKSLFYSFLYNFTLTPECHGASRLSQTRACQGYMCVLRLFPPVMIITHCTCTSKLIPVEIFFFFKLEIIPSEVNAQVKSEFQNFWRDTVLRKLHLKNDISYTKTQ